MKIKELQIRSKKEHRSSFSDVEETSGQEEYELDRGYFSDPTPESTSYELEEEISYGLKFIPDLDKSKLEGEEKNLLDNLASDIRMYNSSTRTDFVKKREIGERDKVTLQNLIDHHDETVNSLLLFKNIVSNLEKCDSIDCLKDINISERVNPIKNSFKGLEKDAANVNKNIQEMLKTLSKS